MDQSQIDAAKARFPDTEIELVSIGGQEILLRSPAEAALDRWQAARAKQGGEIQRNKTFVLDCLARDEDRSAVTSLLARKPGFSARIVDELLKMAGYTAEAESKSI